HPQKNYDGVDETEARLFSRPLVLAPVPPEPLRHEVGYLKTYLLRRAEAGDGQRHAEENEAPVAEHGHERERHLIVMFDADSARKEDERAHYEDGDVDQRAEAHAEGGDRFVRPQIAFVPLVFNCP